MSVKPIPKHQFYLFILIGLLLLVNINPVAAQVANDCEQLAKEYQKIHGGDLVLIQPLKTNGAYDLGEYKGHWINKAYSKDIGVFYYDPTEKNMYSQGKLETVKRDFEQRWNKSVVVLNYNQGGIPFALIWHS